MSESNQRANEPTGGERPAKGRRIGCLLAAGLLVALALGPFVLGERIASALLLKALNDRSLGLSCRTAEVRFSYADLFAHRRIRRLVLDGLTLELASKIPTNCPVAFNGRTAAFRVELAADDRAPDAMRAHLTGRVLDWPVRGEIDLTTSASDLVTVRGHARFACGDGRTGAANGPLAVSFVASPKAWRVSGETERLAFSADDPALAPLLAALPSDLRKSLSFSGEASVRFSAERPEGKSCPTWRVAVPLRHLHAEAERDERKFALDGLSLSVSASGIGEHADLAPLTLRAASVEAASVAITNLYATLLRTDRHFLVSEAGANVCGGAIRLYALSLDPVRLNSGFTLFLDDLDAGEVLNAIPGFRGEASGRLHGKLPLAVRNGRELRLRDAFLYSTPGEKGTLRITDATPILNNLAAAGVDSATRANVSRALANLDYSALKLRLVREGSDSMALNLALDGSATANGKTVPVSFDVTLRGGLEQLLNFGLRTATRKQGNNP